MFGNVSNYLAFDDYQQALALNHHDVHVQHNMAKLSADRQQANHRQQKCG
jgi:hypothetical protein